MEDNFDALEVIARTRGKVIMDDVPTGGMLFPLWGWLTAGFYTLAFILWQLLHQEWCLWLWAGIPVIGIPLMIMIVRKDHERAHIRTRGSRLILDYWILAAVVFGLGGCLFGIFGLYEVAEDPLICMLIGIGAFITGENVRFRPMIAGGILGVAIALGAFLLQGDLWVWQMPAVALTAVAALIVPGHLFERKIKNGV
jgi:hypothetical protein